MNRIELNRALAKALAYAECGKFEQAFDVCQCWAKARAICKERKGNWGKDRMQYFSDAAAQLEAQRIAQCAKAQGGAL